MIFRPLVFIFLFFMISCNSDQTNPLYGHWDVESAKRMDRPTQTLKGLFFKFEPEAVETNLMGSTSDLSYSDQDHQLKIWSNQDTIPFDYKFQEEYLVLTTDYGGERLEIWLKKQEE